MRRLALAGTLAVTMGATASAQEASLTGYWRGTYDCAQGLTGINLTIRQGVGTAVEAVFHFYAVPQNPGVPTGCFKMSGRLDPNTREFVLESDESRWLVRPPDYVVVNFHGILGRNGRSMRGRVEGPGCTQFGLRRLDAPPPAPDPCTTALNLSAVPPGDPGTAPVAAR